MSKQIFDQRHSDEMRWVKKFAQSVAQRFFKKEVARGGERTRVLSISFIFSFSTTLPLCHSGSPDENT
jgi:hypothetical protein